MLNLKLATHEKCDKANGNGVQIVMNSSNKILK